MVLTSSRRRTAGITALFAAFLLILTALFVASPASAEVVEDDPCNAYGYTKIDEPSGTADLAWGSIAWGADAGDLDGNDKTTELSYDIDDGFAVDFCLKAGSVPNTFSGPVFGSGFISHPNPSISHIGWRLVPVAEPEAPTFVDADCDDPNASAVELPETEGVDYAITGTVAPGETVTVDATAKDGYAIDPADTVSWEHTFATVPDNCGDIEAVTAEPTFTDPTCEVNAVGIELPETEGVTYTVSGDEEPGGTVTVTATADAGYFLADDADTSWPYTFGELATDCGPDTSVTPNTPDTPDEEVEVLPNVIEKPAPTPAPAPAPAAQPAAQVAAQELPATGLGSTELLLLALLLMGLGASALLAPDRGREY